MPRTTKISKSKDDLIKKIRNMRKNQERINLDAQGNVIGASSHKMRHEIGEAVGATPGEWYSFPILFPHKTKENRWIEYSEKNIKAAYEEALSRNEVIEFGKDFKSAEEISLGSWKPKHPLLEILKK